MDAYLLFRDDGARLDVSGSAWEAALGLAYLYGWKPAGTETPLTDAWRVRPPSSGALAWDAQDYFSPQMQHVGVADARAFARALSRALQHIPDWTQRPEGTDLVEEEEPELLSTSPMPSRASAVSEGLSGSRRSAMDRLAAFASDGGFTIDGAR